MIKVSSLKRTSVYSIVGMNVIIILLAIIMKWTLFDLLFAYWVENLSVGIFNIMKMIKSQGGIDDSSEGSAVPAGCLKIFMVPFFLVHFFGFCFGHLLAILSLYSGQLNGWDGHIPDIINYIDPSTFLIAFVMTMISHGVSFATNFIGKKEYEKATIVKLMFAPYKRIVLVHLVIIAGAFLLVAKGDIQSVLLLIPFFAAKLILDIILHLREHRETAI
ncbi:DUF6498-containing protein [Paracrocinitomix mangrovi]|uniref:DUF6498-containing protein n=1 Tax=Paracrocinitomix mangrovi TaxID=2862509 RepID=UPI001C8D5A66|nr:DUF6498-containing protein [Paracrocinitomix mangrovi]UKN00951.1 DUF6498-containing protein [Paracrocinitomix mangrovi]